MDRKTVFQGIIQFIPFGFHTSVKDSINHLKGLHRGVKHNIQLTRCMLTVSPEGVQFVHYEHSYSEDDTLTWRALEQLLTEFFPRPSYDINNQTSLFGDLEIQLKNAF